MHCADRCTCQVQQTFYAGSLAQEESALDLGAAQLQGVAAGAGKNGGGAVQVSRDPGTRQPDVSVDAGRAQDDATANLDRVGGDRNLIGAKDDGAGTIEIGDDPCARQVDAATNVGPSKEYAANLEAFCADPISADRQDGRTVTYEVAAQARTGESHLPTDMSSAQVDPASGLETLRIKTREGKIRPRTDDR